MKIRLLFSFVVILFSFTISCLQKESCEQLYTQFESYDKAVNKIKSTHFKIEESANTSKSSWIKNASYYSCDGQKGFFILETSKKQYLFSDLPYEVWKDFKVAESFGTFYNENIRDKYNLSLTK
jgi:hypothetical protein